MFRRRSEDNGEEDSKKDLFGPVADLMVGVVFLFIIILIALSLSIKEKNGVSYEEYQAKVRELQALRKEVVVLRSENERLRKDYDEVVSWLRYFDARERQLAEVVRFVKTGPLLSLLEKLTQADETRTLILSDLRSRLTALNVDVIVDPENGTIRLPSSKLFEVGRADPTPEGREVLQRLGSALQEILPCHLGAGGTSASCGKQGGVRLLNAVYVEGHTDAAVFSSPSGRHRDNWDLSAARAIEAFKLMRDFHPGLKTLKNADGEALLGVSGYAETRPSGKELAQRMDERIREQDRRIELRLTMSADEKAIGRILDDLRGMVEKLDVSPR